MKTPVPVFLYSSGVVGLYRVSDLRRFGKLDDKLAFTTAQGVGSADLVEAASLQQVDVAQFAYGGFLTNHLCILGIVVICRRRAEFREIIFAALPTKLLQLRGQRPLYAKPTESIMVWKAGVGSGFELDLAPYREPAKFSYEPSEVVK